MSAIDRQDGSGNGAVSAAPGTSRPRLHSVTQQPLAGESSRRDAGRRPLRLLVVSSDTYPPFRVDVAVLFGHQLAQRGHRIDWILQSEGACDRSYETTWNGCKVWVG